MDIFLRQQCVIAHVQENMECSQCNIAVTLQSPGYLNCVETLEELYPKPSTTFFDSGSPKSVSVVTLAGNATTVDYSPTLKVYELQNEVHKKLGIPPDKQRLLLRDQELHVSHARFSFRNGPIGSRWLTPISCSLPLI